MILQVYCDEVYSYPNKEILGDTAGTGQLYSKSGVAWLAAPLSVVCTRYGLWCRRNKYGMNVIACCFASA